MKRAFLLLVLILIAAPQVPAQALSAAPQVPPFAPPQVAAGAPTGPSSAQAESAPPQVAIRAVISDQVAAWNRADIPAFMQAYEDSPDTTFIGLTVRKGFQPILQRYRDNYSTPALMGKLTFTDLDVRVLPNACGNAEIALVTGKFHLDRATHVAPTKDDGVFSLVWRNGPHGWKIILDHTS